MNWADVPQLVKTRYALAVEMRSRLPAVVKTAWYNPTTATLCTDTPVAADDVEVVLDTPATTSDWILIKNAQGKVATPLSHVFNAGGLITGGPSPLSNAIVGSLLLGGTGYGIGTLAEQLFPEEYVARGKLRRTLAMAGLGAGAIPGLMQWHANSKMTKQPALRTLVTPNSNTPYDHNLHLQEAGADAAGDKRASDPLVEQTKQAVLRLVPDSMIGDVSPVPVDAFNRAIWQDVGNLTPPPVAAAVSGLVTGIQSQQDGASLLHPKHFMNGLAAAGVDFMTARTVGGVLGALGGLTPNVQKKLQTAGIWSGLVRGVAGSVFGF